LCLCITWPISSAIPLLCSTSLSYNVDNPWRIWFPFHYSIGKRRSIHHDIKVTCYLQTNRRLLPRQRKNRLALWLPRDVRRLEQTSGRLCFTGTHLSRQHLNPAAREISLSGCVPVKPLACMRGRWKLVQARNDSQCPLNESRINYLINNMITRFCAVLFPSVSFFF
jgi:hypothetical protein